MGDCSVINVGKYGNISKFAGGRGSKERVEAARGMGANLKEQITAQGSRRGWTQGTA